MKKYYLCVLVFLSLSAYSQCPPPDAPVSVSCSGTALADNAVISAGQVHVVGTGGGNFSNITIQGGSLVICGSATLTNVNFNAGEIVVNPTGSVTFSGAFNAGSNKNFYNYGSTTFNSNVNVSGTDNFVYNDAGGSIFLNGSMTVVNGGRIVNNGTITGNQLLINSGASVCLGPGSSSVFTDISNNQLNLATVPSGIACVSYSGTFTGNQPITASSGLYICQQPGATAPSPIVLGAASGTLTANCTGCGLILPLTLVSFRYRIKGLLTELEWTTSEEENLEGFSIEVKNENEPAFREIGYVTANNSPSTYTFATKALNDVQVRLKISERDGRVRYSPFIYINGDYHGIKIFPENNPFSGQILSVYVTSGRQTTGTLILADGLGRIVEKKELSLSDGLNRVNLDLGQSSPGQYLLFFYNENERTTVHQVLKR